jgi:hypothetical protein
VPDDDQGVTINAVLMPPPPPAAAARRAAWVAAPTVTVTPVTVAPVVTAIAALVPMSWPALFMSSMAYVPALRPQKVNCPFSSLEVVPETLPVPRSRRFTFTCATVEPLSSLEVPATDPAPSDWVVPH